MSYFVNDIALDLNDKFTLDLPSGFGSSEAVGSIIELQVTNKLGDDLIYFELFDAKDSGSVITKETANNFIRYIKEDLYDNSIFHRSVPGFVLQGGGFSAPLASADEGGTVDAINAFKPIKNEPGNSNLRGTVAMAKLAGDPDSATSQWFINLDDNLALDRQNEGFSVFGKVLGEGMDVVDQLASVEVYNFGGAFSELPLWKLDQNTDNPDIAPDDFLTINNIEEIDGNEQPFTLRAKSSDDKIVDVEINNDQSIEIISYTTSGEVEITLEAISLIDGTIEKITFDVEVSASPEPEPTGFSRIDGYGHIDAQRAVELLLDIDLPDRRPISGDNWNLDNMNIPEVWEGANVSGEGITIAVIDTGVDLDHPEFRGRIVDGYDFINFDRSADDDQGHGTHVAGSIAAANDGIGMTGVAYGANIMPIKVLDSDGRGSERSIISGIYWAVDNGADIINLSLGSDYPSKSYYDALAYAHEQGVIPVMAAGNSFEGSPAFPAAFAVDYGIAVGASDNQGLMPRFSNKAGNQELDYVIAPGVDVVSALPGNEYGPADGTSMAAPQVSGVCALIKELAPDLKSHEIENLITYSASNGRTGSILSSSLDFGLPMDIQTITSENINDFTDIDLQDALVGLVAGKKEKKRKKTIKKMNKKINKGKDFYGDIDEIEFIDATKSKFVTIELSDSIGSDLGDAVLGLLDTNKFEYIHIEPVYTT